jgi:hypothetical protein
MERGDYRGRQWNKDRHSGLGTTQEESTVIIQMVAFKCYRVLDG